MVHARRPPHQARLRQGQSVVIRYRSESALERKLGAPYLLATPRRSLMPRQKDLFKKLVWAPGSLRVNDVVFDHGDDGTIDDMEVTVLEFPKPKRMLEQYERIWD